MAENEEQKASKVQRVSRRNKEAIEAEKYVNTVRKKRKLRKGRKKQSIFRNFFRFCLTVVFIGAFAFISKMPQWYLDENLFTVANSTSVEILNNKIVKSPKILSVLRTIDVPNVPVYLAKTDAIEKELKTLPPIKDVYVRRYAFPARLQILVSEREPVLTVAPDVKVPPVAAFTSDGVLIGREFLPLGKEFKTTKVLSYGNKGDDYTKWDAAKIKEIQNIVEYVETFSKETVEYIDYRNPNDVYVKIKTVNIRLGKIDEGVYDRIKRIPSILPQVKLVDSKVKYLDLSWEKVNYLKLE